MATVTNVDIIPGTASPGETVTADITAEASVDESCILIVTKDGQEIANRSVTVTAPSDSFTESGIDVPNQNSMDICARLDFCTSLGGD